MDWTTLAGIIAGGTAVVAAVMSFGATAGAGPVTKDEKWGCALFAVALIAAFSAGVAVAF